MNISNQDQKQETTWHKLIQELLEVKFKCTKTVKPDELPSPTAPKDFLWIYAGPAEFRLLCDRIEELKWGWKIIPILEKINVKQSGENLAYWHPMKILLFFGIVEEKQEEESNRVHLDTQDYYGGLVQRLIDVKIEPTERVVPEKEPSRVDPLDPKPSASLSKWNEVADRMNSNAAQWKELCTRKPRDRKKKTIPLCEEHNVPHDIVPAGFDKNPHEMLVCHVTGCEGKADLVADGYHLCSKHRGWGKVDQVFKITNSILDADWGSDPYSLENRKRSFETIFVSIVAVKDLDYDKLDGIIERTRNLIRNVLWKQTPDGLGIKYKAFLKMFRDMLRISPPRRDLPE